MKALFITLLLFLSSCSSRSIERYAKWEKACDQGNVGACKGLKKYCDKDSEPACFIIAKNQLRTGGWELAQEAITKSCKLGNTVSCTYIKDKESFDKMDAAIRARPEYISGKIPARNYKSLRSRCKASQQESCGILFIDCEHGVAKACAIIGQESTLNNNEEKGVLFLKKACVLGDNESCKSAETLSSMRNDETRATAAVMGASAQQINAINSMIQPKPIDFSPIQNYIQSFQPTAPSPKTSCVSRPQYLFGKFNGYTTVCD